MKKRWKNMGLDKKSKSTGFDRERLISLADAALKREGVISIIVVLLGFLLGTLLIIFVGKNPSGMYSALSTTTAQAPLSTAV